MMAMINEVKIPTTQEIGKEASNIYRMRRVAREGLEVVACAGGNGGCRGEEGEQQEEGRRGARRRVRRLAVPLGGGFGCHGLL